MKRVGIIGASGSIGVKAVEIVKGFSDRLSLSFISVNESVDFASNLEGEFGVLDGIAITGDNVNPDALPEFHSPVFFGKEGIRELIVQSRPDLIVFAVPGSSMLDVFLFILENGIKVASANKEVFTSGGPLVAPFIREGLVLPIDSEQSAIFQALRSGNKDEVARLILTCSGGPFLGRKRQGLENVTVEDSLNHPRWKMGRKVSLDSATLMNKALELIEASVLFDMPHSKIDIVVHPQAFIHSMVEFCDGNIIMQAGKTDMSIPIQYALSFPERWENHSLSIDAFPENIEFFDVDEDTFSSIRTARAALDKGMSCLPVFDYANELLGNLFFEDKVGFTDIMDITEKVVKEHSAFPVSSLKDIEDARLWVKDRVYDIVGL